MGTQTRILSRPCLPWGGTFNRVSGYGTRYLQSRTVNAHRWAFIEAVGDPGPELQIDHLCFNRICVELTHLEAVTNQENARRAYAYCRKGLHEMSGTNKVVTSVGRNKCRACHNEWKRRNYRTTERARRIERKAEKQRLESNAIAIAAG